MDTSVAAQLLNWQPRQQEMMLNAQIMQQWQAQQQAQQRALAARGTAGGQIENLFQQPQPQVPPPPAAAAPPPGTLSPGGGNPQVMPPGGAPGGGMPPPPAAAAPPPGPPPFRPLPNAAPPGGAPGMVPPPPQAQQQPGQDVVAPPHVDMRKVIENLSKLPPDQRLDVFDQLAPVIQKAQQDEVNYFKMQTTAQAAALKAYEAAIHGFKANTDAAHKEIEDLRRREQGDERIALAKKKQEDANAIAQAKLKRQSGGGAGQGNITKWETDADGNTIGGWTKTGKHIRLEEPQTAKSDRGGFSEEDVNYWSEVLQKGGSLPPRLATTPGGKKLVSDIMKNTTKSGVRPEEMMSNQAQFMGEKAGQRTLGTRTANIEMAGTEADQLADLAQQASMKTARTGIKSLNSAIQAVEKGSASPELRSFVAANTSFINAYARAINPQGVGTVADKEHAREMLDTAFSKGDYNAVIGQLKKEIEAARASPDIVKKSMRERFTGGAKKINGDADYATLPSGAEFIAPDGTTRRKP